MLYPYNRDVITCTYRAHFLTNDGVLLIVRTPAPFSALQRVGTSDMRLKTVQVASILDVCWVKYVFIQLLPGKFV